MYNIPAIGIRQRWRIHPSTLWHIIIAFSYNKCNPPDLLDYCSRMLSNSQLPRTPFKAFHGFRDCLRHNCDKKERKKLLYFFNYCKEFGLWPLFTPLLAPVSPECKTASIRNNMLSFKFFFLIFSPYFPFLTSIF